MYLIVVVDGREHLGPGYQYVGLAAHDGVEYGQELAQQRDAPDPVYERVVQREHKPDLALQHRPASWVPHLGQVAASV